MTTPFIRVADKSKEGFPQASKLFFKKRYPFFQEGEATSEFYISNFKNIYKDSKILVVGGGPTTNAVEWDPNNYDFIFSCNHFFLHPILSTIDVSFACLCPEVDVTSKDFVNYYNKFTTQFCIENPDTPNSQIHSMVKMDKSRVSIAELRVKFKVGVTAHLLILASLFEPFSIDVVGMDGYPPNKQHGTDSNHSFQVGKKMGSLRHSYDMYVQHYTSLWKYLKYDVGRNIKYTNLGKGHPYNISGFLNV